MYMNVETLTDPVMSRLCHERCTKAIYVLIITTLFSSFQLYISCNWINLYQHFIISLLIFKIPLLL